MVLIAVIAFFQTYSILIFYCALNDLIDIVADAAAFERWWHLIVQTLPYLPF